MSAGGDMSWFYSEMMSGEYSFPFPFYSVMIELSPALQFPF